MKLRIATWNLKRPKKHETQRLDGLIQWMKAVNADVWIVTEASSFVSPGEEFDSVATDDIQGEIEYAEGENRTTIWSRKGKLKTIPCEDPETTVCAAIDSPVGPILFYGTIIPYHAAGGRWPYRVGGENFIGRKQWELHYKAIDYHADMISQLRLRHPGYHFCFGGDLNQSRDGRKWPWNREWYGTHQGREKLSALLATNGLQCVTKDDFFATGQLTSGSTVDHICLDNELTKLVTHVEPWEAGNSDSGKVLTDHSGIWVELEAASAS